MLHEYDFNVRITARAPDEGRGRMIAARIEKVIDDALTQDGLAIVETPGNAHPRACRVEVSRIALVEGSDDA